MSHKQTRYRANGRLIPNPSLYCMNCGKRNHKYCNCTDPLNSYGILCFYKHNSNPNNNHNPNQNTGISTRDDISNIYTPHTTNTIHISDNMDNGDNVDNGDNGDIVDNTDSIKVNDNENVLNKTSVLQKDRDDINNTYNINNINNIDNIDMCDRPRKLLIPNNYSRDRYRYVKNNFLVNNNKMMYYSDRNNIYSNTDGIKRYNNINKEYAYNIGDMVRENTRSMDNNDGNWNNNRTIEQEYEKKGSDTISNELIDMDEEPRQLAIKTAKGQDIDLSRYRDVDKYKILMIRRKHTIPYVEFLRGKYVTSDIKYLSLLFSRMTRREIRFICEYPVFSVLRNELGLNSRKRKSYRMEYENSEVKFTCIRDTGMLSKIIYIINKIYKTRFELNMPPGLYPVVNDNKIINNMDQEFMLIYQNIKIQNGVTGTQLYHNPEWGIPKGKRQMQETDLQCAIREFCEETGIAPNDLKVFKNCVPLEEVYTGINGVKYRHVYFMAELMCLPKNYRITENVKNAEDTELEIPMDIYNKGQVGEISAVKLLGFHKAVGLIRRFHKAKKTIIQKAFYNICSYSNFFSIA